MSAAKRGSDPAETEKNHWWKSRFVVGGVALVVGLGIGLIGQAEPTDSAEYRALAEEAGAAEQQVIELQEQLTTLEKREKSVKEDEKSVAEGEKALAATKEALDKREKDIKTKEASLADAEAALQEREAQVAQRESSVDAQEAELAAPPAVAEPEYVEVPVADTPPASVYYKNCTAAREAGAAPVYAGDPGYASHLDRDGDGIGCE